MKRIDKHLTESQIRFLQWCLDEDVITDSDIGCVHEVLHDKTYLQDGNWKRILNGIRDEWLSTYLKYK
jgi:hypothetical protein